MKKALLFVICAVFVSFNSVFAQNLEIQIINAPDAQSAGCKLNDLKIGSEVNIEGFGLLKLTEFAFWDDLYVGNCDSKESGVEADYAVLNFNITNLNYSAKNYLENISVKVIYDNFYEFGGWAFQKNINNNHSFQTINSSENFAIAPFYQGHYKVGATLPNYVIQSKKPLKIVVIIDDIEFTYNIRK